MMMMKKKINQAMKMMKSLKNHVKVGLTIMSIIFKQLFHHA